MIKKEGEFLYLEILSDANVSVLLEDVLEKYRDNPDFKKEYIEFIINNDIHNYLSGEIIISEPPGNRNLKMNGVPVIRTDRELCSIKKIFELLYSGILSDDFSEGPVIPAFFYKKGDIVAELKVERNSMNDNIDVSFNTESFDFRTNR